jgi:Na+-translocating ferredoxin:NAD+ oxidoreductase RnfG subunit
METILSSHRDEYLKNIISEQILFESFLSTVKDFAKDKLGKAIDTIKDWKDAAVVFSQVLSSKELLADFLSPLERLVKKQLQKLYGILKKAKLDSVLKKIEGFFKKIASLEGWKKLFALIAIGGVALYAVNKLPIDGIQSWVTKTLGNNFIETITSNLLDWKKYIGFLGPIVGGGVIIFKLLQPLLSQFSKALKSGAKAGSLAIKLIKENKTKMKKSVLKEIIKKEIFNILKEEEDTPTKVTIPAALIQLIKDLGNDDNLPAIQQALAKIKTGDEKLTPIQNKELADTFIALLKNNDISKLNKFASLAKQIK